MTKGRQPGGPPAAARPSDADDDHRLFLEAMAGARPLPDDHRARLEAPKPIPVPRQRVVDKPQAAAPAPLKITDDASLFRASVGAVTPLKDTGRAAIGHQRPPRHTVVPHPADDTELAAKHGTGNGTAFLPPLPDTNDPAELFRRAVGHVAAIPDKNRAQVSRPLPPPTPRQREQDEQAVLEESITAPLTFEDRLDMGVEDAFLREGLARRVLTDLRRGRWVVQGELDLHGLNREEARIALARFLADALHAGKRCLRLIHGKGLGSPGRESILKQLSRTWLAQREEILAFCQARPQDGGEGALLVLLRAPRNPSAP